MLNKRICHLGLIFIIHVSVSTYYLLSFHNVVLLIGNGKGFFESKLVEVYRIGIKQNRKLKDIIDQLSIGILIEQTAAKQKEPRGSF